MRGGRTAYIVVGAALSLAAVAPARPAPDDAVTGERVPRSAAAHHEVELGRATTDPLAAPSVEALARRLRACARERDPCERLVYVWSPSMALSLDAIPEIREAAAGLGVDVDLLAAEALAADGEGWSAAALTLRDALERAGATVHAPAVVALREGRVLGPAVVGHKRAPGYQRLLAPRFAAPAWAAPPGFEGGRDAGRGTSGTDDLTVVWRHAVSPAPGAFFRRVPGTRWIAYDQRNRVFLIHLETGARFQGPGWIDFVPSPDGAFFATPGPGRNGLEFYDVREVLEAGPYGLAAEVRPFHGDPEMADQYPSIGILARESSGRATRYRVLISWFEGLAFRDYAAERAADGAMRLTPASPKIAACPGMGLSTPILSKDGQELAARNEASGTTRIYRLGDDGECVQVADLGVQTSKVGFSDDGRRIAYSSPESDPAPRSARLSVTYVLDRDSGTTTALPESRSRGLVIPEFVASDSVLILVRPGDRSTPEFRLVCCLSEG